MFHHRLTVILGLTLVMCLLFSNIPTSGISVYAQKDPVGSVSLTATPITPTKTGTVYLPFILSTGTTPLSKGALAIEAGPPAVIQIAAKPIPVDVGGEGEPRFVIAIHVMDEQGFAVVDGTEVRLQTSQGQLANARLTTKHGVGVTELTLSINGQAELVAEAGTVQGRHTVTADIALQSTVKLGQTTVEQSVHNQVVLESRNQIRSSRGQALADNALRQVQFGPNGPTYTAKTHQVESLPSSGVSGRGRVRASSGDSIGFELTGIHVGSKALFSGGLTLRSNSNQAIYTPADETWHMVYEVSDDLLQQGFVFEEPIAAVGDLVITGQFRTNLHPEFVSSEAGVRFVQQNSRNRRSRKTVLNAETTLGYGPAWATDVSGHHILLEMDIQGDEIQLTVPRTWLAEAVFPVEIDPLIGPAEQITDIPAEVGTTAIASDGTHFLSVWEQGGDIYGRLVDNQGKPNSLITISSADGLQLYPDVVYNRSSDEYLVIWEDRRVSNSVRMIV